MDFIRMAFSPATFPNALVASLLALVIAKSKSNPSKTDKNRQKIQRKKKNIPLKSSLKNK